MEPDGASTCAPPDGQGADGARSAACGEEALPGRSRCLLGNWQEERATEHLDCLPRAAPGGEGVFFRHGHPALLTLEPGAPLAHRTTTRDSFGVPRPTGLPKRGLREARMEWLLTQKHRKEVLEGEVQAPLPPTPLSTMHQEYRWEGPMSAPPAPTKPHDYRLEEPQTFWREHVQQVPGISHVRTEGASFKKCAIFTTAVPESLDLPWPYCPEFLAK